jgi:MFS family permease
LKTTNPLIFPLFITGFVLFLLSLNVIVTHIYGTQWQQPLDESERIFWRTIFYILAILVLPMTNLLRHIFLRLNQTMPLLNQSNVEKIARKRYALTVCVSQIAMLFIGILAGIVFYLGDGFNTFHILSGLATLGAFLYRPKIEEYQHIINALTQSTENSNE